MPRWLVRTAGRALGGLCSVQRVVALRVEEQDMIRATANGITSRTAAVVASAWQWRASEHILLGPHTITWARKR